MNLQQLIRVLEELPTLHSGQFANLKIETEDRRVWLSRMTAADGETQPVQIERLIEGRWVDVTDEEVQQ